VGIGGTCLQGEREGCNGAWSLLWREIIDDGCGLTIAGTRWTLQ